MRKSSEELQLAVEAAKRAGKILKNGWGKVSKITSKGKYGIVTNIDFEAEKAVIDLISKNSRYPIVAEESNHKIESDTFWAIDPLDGTTNYSKNIPLFSTSIGLVKNGKAFIGAIFNPVTDEFFTGEVTRGAFVNGKPIAVSPGKLEYRTSIFTDYGYQNFDKKIYLKLTEKLLSIASPRRCASAAIEMAYTAQGSSVAFAAIGGEVWDYAAGAAIIEAAGGKVTDWNGNSWLNEKGFMLASNGNVHKDLMKLIGPLQKS